MIKVENLTFGYKKNRSVLKNVSFSCEQGSINVLIGLNGSGKTTLIKIIAGLLVPCEGNVFIAGSNLAHLSIRKKAKTLAYVSQKTSAADDFCVKDYLLFGKVNCLKFYQTPSATDVRKVLEIAEQFGITQLLDKKIGELSGGERQIVSICSAIVQSAEIILLDEPTSALDIKNQAMVLNLIKKISAEEKKTFLLSSHNPNQALYLNSHVFLLQDGVILKEGEAKQIITTDNLKSIYGESIKYSKDLEYNEVTF